MTDAAQLVISAAAKLYDSIQALKNIPIELERLKLTATAAEDAIRQLPSADQRGFTYVKLLEAALAHANDLVLHYNARQPRSFLGIKLVTATPKSALEQIEIAANKIEERISRLADVKTLTEGATFNANNIITSSDGQAFWIKHFGADCKKATNCDFIRAITHEGQEANNGVLLVSLKPEFNGQFGHLFDQDDNGEVDVYEFAALTKTNTLRELVKAVQEEHTLSIDDQVYTGCLLDGAPVGVGKLVIEGESKNEQIVALGPFKEGQLHGSGVKIFAPDPTNLMSASQQLVLAFEGDFANGMPHGQGTRRILVDMDGLTAGEQLHGNFKNGKEQGVFQVLDSHGNDIPHAVCYYNSGKLSQGHYVGQRDPHGKINGRGTFYSSGVNGGTVRVRVIGVIGGTFYSRGVEFITYEGLFANGAIVSGEHRGTRRHEGEWEAFAYQGHFCPPDGKYSIGAELAGGGGIPGLYHGQGKMTYVNGDVYEGQWEADERHGQGKRTYVNGDVYEGQWEADERHGQGKVVHVSGNAVYEGQYEADKMHGQGKRTYASGNVYEGQWEAGKRHGQGKITSASGDNYEGQWEAGKTHGQGKRTYVNGDVYEGQREADEMHGVGSWRSLSLEMQGSFQPIPTLDPPEVAEEEADLAPQFNLGAKLSVLSPTDKWRAASVAEVDGKDKCLRVKVHYDEFDSKHDEWIDGSSDRLRSSAAPVTPRGLGDVLFLLDVSFSGEVARQLPFTKYVGKATKKFWLNTQGDRQGIYFILHEQKDMIICSRATETARGLVQASSSAPAQTVTPPPAPAPPDRRSEGGESKDESLVEWLEGINLQHTQQTFSDLGANSVSDLLDLEDDDIDGIGLKTLEKRRLSRRLEQLREEKGRR
jgi:hypothetical protein